MSDEIRTEDARAHRRFAHVATILIDEFPQGAYRHGKMINYSSGGLCFASTVVRSPGAPLVFGIEDTPYAPCPGVYHGHVKWCRRLPEKTSLYPFVVGAAYVKPELSKAFRRHGATVIRTAPTAMGSKTDPKPRSRRKARDRARGVGERRRHRRRSFDNAPFYASSSRILRGTIKDIGKGGMYIEAADGISVGEHLNIVIPAVRGHPDVTVRAEILRVDAQGWAVRFSRLF
jgi:hypothetical protein